MTTVAVAGHDAKVAALAAQLRALDGTPAHIDKGGTRHFVPRAGDGRFRGRAVDTSSLTEILTVDAEARVCVAEPGATFAGVVRRTLAEGLLPKVVPELEGITLGGAVAGCSVESMSFRYGGFHDTCLEYEIVDGTGAVRTFARGDELFEMLHGSYGTLAILTRITFELVPAQPFVELEYRRHATYAAFEADLRARCADDEVDFVDGIVHGPDHLTLCVGRFAASAGAPSDYRGTEVYYRSTAVRERDVMTTFDYCFRYDRECHWLSRSFPPLEWRPVRRAVGRWFLGSENLIRWSNRLGRVLSLVTRRPDVVVDVFIPLRRLREFWDWYAGGLAHWPLWIVPYRVERPYPWIADAHAAGIARGELMIDCAVYGKRNNARAVDWSAAIEEKTYSLGGIKTLISENHHTRERFWQIYDQPRWSAAKAQLDPHGAFAGLYEKFHRA